MVTLHPAVSYMKTLMTSKKLRMRYLKYGLVTTTQGVSFVRSTICLPCGEPKRILENFNPTSPNCSMCSMLLQGRPQPKEKVYDSPQRFGYILALPTSTYLICPTSPPLSEHHECGVVVYGFGGAKQSTKISIRCQSCRNIYNYTTFGNAGYGWKLYGEPGIALRPAT